jgi:hypothetical protein
MGKESKLWRHLNVYYSFFDLPLYQDQRLQSRINCTSTVNNCDKQAKWYWKSVSCHLLMASSNKIPAITEGKRGYCQIWSAISIHLCYPVVQGLLSDGMQSSGYRWICPAVPLKLWHLASWSRRLQPQFSFLAFWLFGWSVIINKHITF